VLVARLALYVVLAEDDAVEIIYPDKEGRPVAPTSRLVPSAGITNGLVGAIVPLRRLST
jgi:hypothetical protein